MLLSITCDRAAGAEPGDLGFLLHKHPARFQSFPTSFGRVHVFYPDVTDEACTACLLLDVDPVGIVRGKNPDQSFTLGQYVNDRPYAASSFLSVAISQVFGSALNGVCKNRPGLASTALSLTARLDVAPVRGGERFLRAAFGPLGYEVEAEQLALDEQFPEWGQSPYFAVTLRHTVTLSALLSHLYVLVPVLAGSKHYFVGEGEVEKLLAKGAGWLATHPERDEIARRYLRRRPSLVRRALERLTQDDGAPAGDEDAPHPTAAEANLETPLSLNRQRMAAVLDALKASGARRVLDLGCGEGKLLKHLMGDPRFESIVGVDVTLKALEIAERRLNLDRHGDSERVRLLHGSLSYRDARLSGFDAAAVVEVVEHFDPPRLGAFEDALFAAARPRVVVVTTPNREYNAVWETLPAGKFRHPDHRFEWTRGEFRAWADGVAGRHGYAARFLPVGPEHAEFGPPTQMAVFERGG